jgi:tetratricopeptide (TPR) repeat protein
MVEPFSYDVFLSHSSKDKAVVRAVAERLRKDGLKVWFDEWEIKPGDSIPAKLEEGLEHSRVLVLCMSANAFGSDWAQLEAGTFRFRDPLNRERRFIPLRLDDCHVKGSLAQFLHINWLPAAREQEYPKLLELCHPPAKPPMTLDQPSVELANSEEIERTAETDDDKKRAAERRWQYIQGHPIRGVEVLFILKGAVGFDWFRELLDDTRLTLSRDEPSLRLGQLLAGSSAPNTKEPSCDMEQPVCSFWETYQPEAGYWFKRIAPAVRAFSTVAGFDAVAPWSALGIRRVERLQDLALLTEVGVSIPARAYEIGVEEFEFRFIGDTFSFSVQLSEHGLSFLHEMASTQHVVVKGDARAPIGSMFTGVQLLEMFYRQTLPRPKADNPKPRGGVTGMSGPNGKAVSFYPCMPIGFSKTPESNEYTFTITVPAKIDTTSLIKELERKLKSSPADAKSYAELAAVHSHDGRLQDALRCLETGMKQATPDPDVQGMMAEILSKMGRFEEALALYRKEAELFPNAGTRIKSAVQNGLGVCLHELGKDDEALAHFQAAARIEPSKSCYQFNLSMAFAAVERHSEALASAQRAVELAPEDHRAAMYLGVLLTMEDRTTEAMPQFERATQLLPESGDAHELLGQHLARANQHEKAVVSLQRAVKIEETAMRYDLLGASFGNLNRWSEAETAFRRGVELEPNNSGILANLGATVANQGRLAEAVGIFEQLLRTDPKNTTARQSLARLREIMTKG